MSSFRHQVTALYRQAKRQTAALKPLGEVFAQEAMRIFRHDQVMYLRSFKASVLREVDNIQETERAARYGYNEAAFFNSALNFGIGVMVATMTRSHHPLSLGMRLALRDLAKTAPFGTVLVAVERGSLPDNIKVIPLSCLARESGRPESDIEAELQADGYLIMTPRMFSDVLDELECGVLDGSLSLPVTAEQLSSG